MDQSKPAERQGVEGEASQEKEDREERETWDSREDAHALEMEDKGGGGEAAAAEEQEEEQPVEEDGTQLQQEVNVKQEEHIMEQDYGTGIIKETYHLDDQAQLITVEEVTPACGLVSILKKRSVCVSACSGPVKAPAKRRVHFKVTDDGYDQEVGGGDSCLLLFLLCLVTVVISIGGTALYCALGDAQSTVCQDFSRNADFYVGQMQRGISHLQHWFAPGS
ncbi:unnamed protein product [Merluccius merluccius]